MDEKRRKLASAVHSMMIRALAGAERTIVRQAVMEADDCLLAKDATSDRLNEGYAYFANFLEAIRAEGQERVGRAPTAEFDGRP